MNTKVYVSSNPSLFHSFLVQWQSYSRLLLYSILFNNLKFRSCLIWTARRRKRETSEFLLYFERSNFILCIISLWMRTHFLVSSSFWWALEFDACKYCTKQIPEEETCLYARWIFNRKKKEKIVEQFTLVHFLASHTYFSPSYSIIYCWDYFSHVIIRTWTTCMYISDYAKIA